MADPAPPDPEVIARAWELHVEGKSLRTIAEHLKAEGVAEVSHETVRTYLKRARMAEAWLVENADGHDELGLPHLRSKFSALLDRLIADGISRYNGEGGAYEQVAPIVLRAAVEQARMLGLYAPARVSLEDRTTPSAEVDPDVVAAVDAARRRAEQERSAQLTGDEDS